MKNGKLRGTRRKKMGRPEKLSQHHLDRIALLLRSGCYIENAAACAGISRSTFYRWLRRGETQARGKYRNFWDTVTVSLAICEVRHVSAIAAAAQTDWRAAAWLLERRFSQRW